MRKTKKEKPIALNVKGRQPGLSMVTSWETGINRFSCPEVHDVPSKGLAWLAGGKYPPMQKAKTYLRGSSPGQWLLFGIGGIDFATCIQPHWLASLMYLAVNYAKWYRLSVIIYKRLEE